MASAIAVLVFIGLLAFTIVFTWLTRDRSPRTGGAPA
jgi:ABC-type sugar transport system permease subunit